MRSFSEEWGGSVAGPTFVYYVVGTTFLMQVLCLHCADRIETHSDEGVTGAVRGCERTVVWTAGDFGLSQQLTVPSEDGGPFFSHSPFLFSFPEMTWVWGA